MRGVKRPLQNAPFCPISALGSNFNPQNTRCIPVVKIFACLELEPQLNIKNRFNGAGKIEHFSKVSLIVDERQYPVFIRNDSSNLGYYLAWDQVSAWQCGSHGLGPLSVHRCGNDSDGVLQTGWPEDAISAEGSRVYGASGDVSVFYQLLDNLFGICSPDQWVGGGYFF